MPLKWTNRSRPPSSGVMKPKPLSSLNHFTVPVAIPSPSTPACLKRSNGSRRPLRTREPYQGLRREGTRGAAPQTRCKSGLAERLRGSLDLLGIALRRRPWQAQRIVLVARDDVDVEVEYGLPGGASARVDQVHSGGP